MDGWMNREKHQRSNMSQSQKTFQSPTISFMKLFQSIIWMMVVLGNQMMIMTSAFVTYPRSWKMTTTANGQNYRDSEFRMDGIRSSKCASAMALSLSHQSDMDVPPLSGLHNGSSKVLPRRVISKMERFSRLPVWPVWQGLLLFLCSRIFGEEVADKLEHEIGGRVCPNFFAENSVSPFIMLVHHRHRFYSWDVLGHVIDKFIFPEGFPAHPHRGFITVTYCMQGGMIHRDSLGVKQVYGANSEGKQDVQWLTTGSGMLHEEMWNMKPLNDNPWKLYEEQELYQLWLNVPAEEKLCAPKVELLGADEMPIIVSSEGKCTTKVIAGTYQDKEASVEISSSLNIFHVQMEPSSSWCFPLPDDHATGIIYMRTGSISVGDKQVPPHYTAYLESTGKDLIVENKSKMDKTDFLFLSGAPLREPVAARGSMVMNNAREVEEAYRDYQEGKMGIPWNHVLDNDQWKKHVKEYPSSYK